MDTIIEKKGRCGNQHARNESYAPITHNARGSHHAKTDFPSFVLLPLIRMHVVHRRGRHGRRSGQHETTRDPAPPFGQITKELRIAGSRQNPTSPGAKLNPGGDQSHQPRRKEARRRGRELRNRDSTPPWAAGEYPACPPRVTGKRDPPNAPRSICRHRNGNKGTQGD